MSPASDSPPPQCTIHSLSQYVGELVTLRGWVTHLRSSGKVRFVVLRDGTGLAQGVLVQGRLPEADFAAFDSLTLESSLTVSANHTFPMCVRISTVLC